MNDTTNISLVKRMVSFNHHVTYSDFYKDEQNAGSHNLVSELRCEASVRIVKSNGSD